MGKERIGHSVVVYLHFSQPPDAALLKEIEIEVNRLLKPAENESIEILNADEYLLFIQLYSY